MDLRLLDEMAGAKVPPSPGAYKQQADDRMWAELGEGDSGDSSPRAGDARREAAPSSKGKARSAGIVSGGLSRKSRRRRENAFETDSKRDHTSFRWTEKHEKSDSYFPFGDDDDDDDVGPGGRGGNDDLEPLRIKDLDVFFTHVYAFFKEKGLWCMVTSRLVNLVNLGFTIFFSTFLFLFVDWQALSVCGVEDGDGCGNFSNYVDWDLTSDTFTFWEGVVVFYFATFCVFWLWTLYSFFPVLK